ncbi:MAG: DUF58 domain-containing protein [Bdellovibrionales bacterium]|nr:DUF58 domain-containing protein [Bdellovibrionales bacterium]
MRTVKLKTLRDYIKIKNHGSQSDHKIPLFYKFRDIFTPFTVLVASLLIVIVPALTSRTGWILIGTTISFLIYLYFYARTIARRLHITRTIHENKLVEDMTLSISYKIHNRSSFLADRISFHDHFGPSQESEIWQTDITPLKPNRYQKVLVERTCDDGMGMHRIGPIEITVSDPFGIFEFVVNDNATTEVMTYPSVSRINSVNLAGSALSTNFGFQEVSTSGSNVNFTSLRPYVQGDPIKHIAWKASAKSPTLLVKEFERSVNSNITLILNLDPTIHLGYKSLSTWEICRDVCLSFVRREVQLQNSIQLISQTLFVPFGQGLSHFSTISHQLCTLNIFENMISEKSKGVVVDLFSKNSRNHILNRSRSLVPKFSTLIYLSPYNPTEMDTTVEQLGLYKQEKVDVIAIFIDPNILRVPLISHLPIEKIPPLKMPIEDIEDRLQRKGIQCYQIHSKDYHTEKTENFAKQRTHTYYLKRASR